VGERIPLPLLPTSKSHPPLSSLSSPNPSNNSSNTTSSRPDNQQYQRPYKWEAHLTFLPANHCEGAIMALVEFEVKEIAESSQLQQDNHQKVILRNVALHTGDFRWDLVRRCSESNCSSHELLDDVNVQSLINKTLQIDDLFIDTTYLTPSYTFPPQEIVIQAVLKVFLYFLYIYQER